MSYGNDDPEATADGVVAAVLTGLKYSGAVVGGGLAIALMCFCCRRRRPRPASNAAGAATLPLMNAQQDQGYGATGPAPQ